MFYSGTQGQMLIDGVKAAKVRSWSLNTALSLLDTTTLGDTDTTSTAGIRTNTGSCQIFYYNDGTPSGNSAKVLLNKLIKAGTDGVAPETATVKLRLAVNDGKNYIEGPAYLTSVGMSCAVGEVLSADVAFQINGAWTEVTL